MYLGTKVKFRSTMLPQSFQNENFEEFKDFKKVERKKIHRIEHNRKQYANRRKP